MMFVGMFLFSLFFTELVRRFLLSKNIIDMPNHRSLHCVPKPRGGGLSFVVIIFFISIFLAYKQWIPFSFFYALSTGLVVAWVGWCDDLKKVRPLYRVIMHLSAASIATYFLGGMPQLNLGTFTFSLPFKGYPLAILIITWCINLYNFMDGADGLATSEAIFASFVAGLLLSIVGQKGLSLFSYSIAAVLMGFLILNWSPAKLFMGDVGSGYLGFIFGVLIVLSQKINMISFPCWCVILAVFFCDATFTLFSRLLRGKRWYEAHCEHAYQRLIQRGISHGRLSLALLFFNVVVLFPCVCFMTHYSMWSLTLALGVLLMMFLFWFKINFPFLKELG